MVHEVMVAWCSLSIASFPGLPTIQFLIACKQYGKWSKTGEWEGLGMRLPLVMVIWLVCLGIFCWCSVELPVFARFKSEVCSMSKLQLPEWTFPNTAIGIPKPNSRCSSLPSVSEVPYMEGFIYLQAEVAYCSWKDCMDFSTKVFSLWLVNMT